jgi:Amt family ammonium transporter
VFAAASLGGVKVPTTTPWAPSCGIQIKSVLMTIVWSGVVSFVAYKIVDILVGLRVSEEAEREGLDITAHGETAYRL